jgi:hypothetical protein
MARFVNWWQRVGREYDVRANTGVAPEVYKNTAPVLAPGF